MSSQLTTQPTQASEKSPPPASEFTEDEERQLLEFRYKLLPTLSRKEYDMRYTKYVTWLKAKHKKLQPQQPEALKLYFNYLEEVEGEAASSIISEFSEFLINQRKLLLFPTTL